MSCPHDYMQIEIAVPVESYCPLCQATEIERLRAAIKKAGAMLGQGYSRTAVSDHLQQALT